MRIKIWVPSIGENWILDRITKEFSENTKHEIVQNPSEATLAWCITPSLVPLSNKHSSGLGRLVTSIQHVVPEKFDEAAWRLFVLRDQYIDHYITANDTTVSFLKNATQRDVTKIPYWINTDIFYHIPDLKDRDFLTIGSFQRDTEGHDLISPKLEKGPDRFLDVIDALRKEYKNLKVLLAGWRRQYVISGLERMGVSYEYNEFCDFDELNTLYNKCDYYIVTSRCEGGPQAILEAAQTRCNVLSTDVGIARDILDEQCICYNINDFVSKIKSNSDFRDKNFNNVQQYEMKKIVKQYDRFFENV